MCFNTQKSIRVSAELCDAIQAYALSNRIALKPRWFSDFINSAVREKLIRDGFLVDDSNAVAPASSPSATALHADGSPVNTSYVSGGSPYSDNPQIYDSINSIKVAPAFSANPSNSEARQQ